MNILITGGNSFVGKNLYESWKNKYNIFNPNSSELNLLNESNIKDWLTKYKFDVVIHTATYDVHSKLSTKDKNLVLENNLKMFFNIEKHDHLYGRLISFGSGAEFDRAHWIPKMSENYFGKNIPSDQYGLSKYIISKYIKNTNKKIYNLRLFAVFGKYESWADRFISNAICRTMFDLPIVIRQNRYFDYIYIDDLVKITEFFLNNRLSHKVYNICSGKSIELQVIADKVKTTLNKDINTVIEKDGLDTEYSGTNYRLLDEMNNYNCYDYDFISMDKSIKDLCDWYSKNIHLVKKELL